MLDSPIWLNVDAFYQQRMNLVLMKLRLQRSVATVGVHRILWRLTLGKSQMLLKSNSDLVLVQEEVSGFHSNHSIREKHWIEFYVTSAEIEEPLG